MSAVTVSSLVDDLAEEHAALAGVVDPLSTDDWARATPSPGWTVAHQIAHLTYFDETARTAIVEPDRFRDETAALLEQMTAGADMDALTLSWAADLSPGELNERWRQARQALITAAGDLDEKTRLPWYGPSMSGKSFLTARLMETWAHGQDVVDTVGGHRDASDRLRHIAQLGVITRGWSYLNRGLEPPAAPVAVDLAAPSGERWTWHEDAEQSVRGPAEDFCLVVTQRRHVDDTELVIDGPDARDWMTKAQAFAGGATDGPARRSSS